MADTRTSIHDVPDDLVEAILLRVSSPVCLARAGAACRLSRCLIADARFTSRFRSLHAPAVAGCYFNSCRSFWSMPRPWTSIRPSFDPSPASGIHPRNLSLDFLSDDVIAGVHRATVLDSRASLLLVEFMALTYKSMAFPDVLVVCEPLTRSYRKIPAPRDFDDNCLYWRSYLIDGNNTDDGCTISMSNFRVLCELYRGGVAHAAVFRPAGGSADDSSWSERAINHVIPKLDHNRRSLGHAAGSWYFHIRGMTTWIVLDGSTGEYTSSALPTAVDWNGNCGRYVTNGRDGKPRIITVLKKTVKVFARLGGNGEWALDKSICLRYNDMWHMYMWTKSPGFIIVQLEHEMMRQFLSVDLETMEVRPDAEEKWNMMYPCTLPCPPALHACLDTQIADCASA